MYIYIYIYRERERERERERGYIKKTGIQFREVTVGLASKTLQYPFEF